MAPPGRPQPVAIGPAGLAEVAALFARRLPDPPRGDAPWVAQSLASGAAGIALLHIERAHAGLGPWRRAHAWISNAAAGQISAADIVGLYLGAPAIAFMLHAAQGPVARYADALSVLNAHVCQIAHRRVEVAMNRIVRGEPCVFAEYDIFSGLTGIGAYLLRADPGGRALERVLSYLVALTRPVRADGQNLPGWWVSHGPRPRSPGQCPGGHGNLGAAHGVSGPLLLLAQATRRGVTVDGQPEAMIAICDWLGRWRQDGDAGPWWPPWVSLPDLRAGRPAQRGAGRPSWCYGTTGIGRAMQLAGIALNDPRRQRAAEDALGRCLANPAQLTRITDAGMCHGWAGVYQTAWRAARDATTPAIAATLPSLTAALTSHARPIAEGDPGFLDGDAGTALALHTAAQDAAPISGWDSCLLID
jgi:hypothetical protein